MGWVGERNFQAEESRGVAKAWGRGARDIGGIGRGIGRWVKSSRQSVRTLCTCWEALDR